jgi:hypothetical protein
MCLVFHYEIAAITKYCYITHIAAYKQVLLNSCTNFEGLELHASKDNWSESHFLSCVVLRYDFVLKELRGSTDNRFSNLFCEYHEDIRLIACYVVHIA